MKSKQSVILKCQASKQWTYIVKENKNEVDYGKLLLKKSRLKHIVPNLYNIHKLSHKERVV